MKVDVLDLEGKKLREVELPSAIFEAPINVDLMHQAYVRQMANATDVSLNSETHVLASTGNTRP